MQFEYNKDISFEFVVLSADMEIMDVARRIYYSPRSEWQTGVNNYKSAVDALESLVWPYLDGTVYPKKMQRLRDNAMNLVEDYHQDRMLNKTAYVRKGRNYEMQVFLKMIEIQWRFIQIELKKQGYLRQTRAHAVDVRGGGPSGAVDTRELLEEIKHDIGNPAA